MSTTSTYAAPGTTAYILTGTTPSNTYIGASRVLGKVYEAYELDEYDRIYVTVGGMFLATPGDGCMREVRFAPADRHPFEHGGNPNPLPAGARPVAARPFREWELDRTMIRYTAPPAGARRFGALDWVVD